ncbi:Ig-like domain-containing protein [Rhizobium sp. LjRoot254]|uniref:Ig-like domain-containing protein n=1 Tax=Rhizobium sp. LjRoot254 TaxID=3342297 RepID=UPI003ECDFBB7
MLIVPVSYSSPVRITQTPFSGSHSTGFDAAALDFDVDFGTAVVAITSGRLISAFCGDAEGEDNGSRFGNFVTIEHSIEKDGGTFKFYTTYAHLEKDSVLALLSKYDLSTDAAGYWDALDDDGMYEGSHSYWIGAGEEIARTGNTGFLDRSGGGDGSHLHIHFSKWHADGSGLNHGTDGWYADGRPKDDNRALLNELTFFGGQKEGGGTDISLSDIGVGNEFNSNLLHNNAYTSDIITGGSGDDIFLTGSGNDLFVGGGGNDTAIFSGSLQEFNIRRIGETVQARRLGEQGWDRFEEVDRFRFSDREIPFSSLPTNCLIRDGVQINHTYEAIGGFQAVLTSSSARTFLFNLADLGRSMHDLLTKSVRELLLESFSIIEPISNLSGANFESNSPERPTFYQLNSSELPTLFLDTSYTQIGIVGLESVNISDVMSVEPVSDDHGDTIADAATWVSDSVGAAESISGKIETGADADVFSVKVAAGTEYTFFSLANISTYTELDTVLEIFDAQGNRVAWNDDSVLGLSSFIRWTAASSGTYYAKVSSYSGTIGNYTLYGSDQSSNGNAEGLNQTDEPDLPSTPSYWHWEGDDDDDHPSRLILEQGGAPSVEEDNRYRGHDGDDVIYANDGDDIVYGDDDEDRLYGENGDDTLFGGEGEDRLYGGEDDDQLHGEDDDDDLNGNDGDDYLHGGVGDDDVDGDDGDDYLKGGAGEDGLSGGDGNDEMYGDEDDDSLRGGSGNDLLFGGEDDDELWGDSGDDRLAGQAGIDVLRGGLGDDLLYAGDGNDILIADGGNDLLHGEDGIDTADFGDGELGVTINLFDEVAVSDDFGRDTLYDIENIIGSNGNDSIDGDHETNVLEGGRGDDRIRGHNGDDDINGGWDDDIVWGDEGNDVVHGSNGDDEVRGGLGDDTLYGDSGGDELRGEQGNDLIYGGSGIDAAFFWGERQDFSILRNDDGSYRVEDLRSDGQEGIDTVYEIEAFRFFDGDVAVEDILSTAPTAEHDEVSVTEDEAILFDAALNDSDVDENELFVSAVDADGQNIYAEMVDGKVVIDPRGKFDTLDIGETASITIAYTVSDGTGFYGTSDVTVTITGAKESVLLSEVGRNFVGTEDHEDIVGTDRADRVDGGDGNDILRGFGGNDRLLGADGADRVEGGKGVDFISGGSDDDLLIGNGQDDIFKFARRFDKDIIADFQPGKDVIDLRSFDLTSFKELRKLSFTDGDNVGFDFGFGDELILQGVKRRELEADDFML